MRNLLLLLPLAATCALLASHAGAQPGARPPVRPGEFGFQVINNTTNTGAGSLCSGTGCTASVLNVKGGDSVTVTVRAPKNVRFVTIVGAKANLCVTLPWALHKWAVAPIVVLPGLSNKLDTGPRCFGWKGAFTVPVPRTIGKGSMVALQVLADLTVNGRIQPAFSVPVEIKVP